VNAIGDRACWRPRLLATALAGDRACWRPRLLATALAGDRASPSNRRPCPRRGGGETSVGAEPPRSAGEPNASDLAIRGIRSLLRCRSALFARFRSSHGRPPPTANSGCAADASPAARRVRGLAAGQQASELPLDRADAGTQARRQASPASRTNPGQPHEFPPASSLRRSSRLEFLAGTPAPWRPAHRESGVVPTVLAGQVALPHVPRATSSAVQASWPQAMAPLTIHAVDDPRSPPRRHASARRRGFVRPNVRKQTL